MIIDKNTIRAVLGALAKKPQLLGQVDKYVLTTNDFSTRFERYVFSAIYGLYTQGAKSIEAADVVNYLSSDGAAKTAFENANGIEWFQDTVEFANVDSFDYYYNRLKKLNLLRDLKKQGFDVSEFYPDDLTDPNADTSKFEELTVSDICAAVRKKLLGLEATYNKTGEVETESAVDGIYELIDEIGTEVQIGAAIQGRFYNKVIGGAERGALTIRSGSSGLGKALPNSTKIPTPNGWKKVGEIQEGDYLFDAFGKPTKVLKVFPQGEKEVWQVTFKDGRTAKCCSEHLWSYNTSAQKKADRTNRRFYTSTLKEISEQPLMTKSRGYRFFVPQSYAVQYPKKDYYLSPYVMGLILGDGSFRQHESNKSFQFSSETDELPKIIAEEMDWFLKKNAGDNYTWYFSTKEKQSFAKEKINVWVEDVLKEFPELINAKSEDKYIPRLYLEGSVHQRFDLLNGLLDTDGSVDEKGRISYFTVSPYLRDNVIELCQSLGLKATYLVDTHKENTLPLYAVHITGRPKDKLNLFGMERKRKKIEEWYNNGKRKEANEDNAITKIEDLGYTEEMTCFLVDNSEHLFLTEGFSATHNTRQTLADALFLAYPVRWEDKKGWIQTGSNERVLFIMTEQTFTQIRKMILAYLTNINEGRFKLANFTEDEKLRLKQAAQIMEHYKENLTIVKMPNPTIESLKNTMREACLTRDIGYVFFDYIQINPALLNEFKGAQLRNDKQFVVYITFLLISKVASVASGQLSRKAKVVREPKSQGDMVIPRENKERK